MGITATQRAERTQYIGASDAAAVLGLSRWSSPLQVWAEKTGAVTAQDKSAEFAVRLGTVLEDDVCELYEAETGRKVHHEPRTLRHPVYPFLAVNLDGRLDKYTDFEAKTAAYVKADEWAEDEIPPEYILQGFHSMAVTGKPKHAIACLLLGGGTAVLVHKEFVRDDEIIEEMVKREVKFWREFVEPRRRPTEVKPHDGDILFRLFPREDNGAPIALDDDADKLADARDAMLQDKRALNRQIDKMSNELRAILGEHSWGKTARFKVSWRNEDTVELDTKALKKAMPEVYEKFVQRTPKRVLRVTKRRLARSRR
jgi:putative phage-type endonuclease